MTTEKKNYFNSMKIDWEINFSDLRQKSENKSHKGLSHLFETQQHTTLLYYTDECVKRR